MDCRRTACICDEREWCTDYGTPNWVLDYFNSVIKCVKQCCCTLILLPKSTLNGNLTTTNLFFTNDDWQHGRLENFESDHQYESNLESDVRFEIESNHEPSLVLTMYSPLWSREHCRISPPYFLAECHMRRLNQISFVLLYFTLFAFSGLYLVFVVIFVFCPVFFSV